MATARAENSVAQSPHDGAPSDDLLQALTTAEGQLAELNRELSAAQQQLVDAQTRIDILQAALEAQAGQNDSQPIKARLDEILLEVADLRQQNSELAAKLAQQTAGSMGTDGGQRSFNQERLSWEERKQLILRQLENDSGAVESMAPEQRLEIQNILDMTQKEIDRREQEIEELREIVRSQSEAREGVAIGAGLAGIRLRRLDPARA